MKRMKHMLCWLTAVAMLFTLTSVGAFATEGMDAEGQAVNEKDVQAVQETAEPEEAAPATTEAVTDEEEGIEDVTLSVASEPAVQTLPRPASPRVTALAGYKSIKLVWPEVAYAEAYNIGMYVNGKWRSLGVTRNNWHEVKGCKDRTTYTFRVFAVRLKADAKTQSNLDYKDIDGYPNSKSFANVSAPTYVKKQCVNRIRYTGTMKRDRPGLKKGTRVYAEDYSAGAYYIRNSRGKKVRVGRISLRNVQASYVGKGKWNYTKSEAEYFVNGYMKARRVSSKKNIMIWVSSYTQHLYIMKKQNGVWKATNWNWEVSMGKKDTPSPTGNKVIERKVSSRHGIPYWNCFSSWNALHGVKSGWGKKLGSLASSGCIRNASSNAKIIRNNCPKGTRVVIY